MRRYSQMTHIHRNNFLLNSRDPQEEEEEEEDFKLCEKWCWLIVWFHDNSTNCVVTSEPKMIT